MEPLKYDASKMNKILAVKDWKSAQFTYVNSNLIYLHKCNRHITLGGKYRLKSGAITFIRGLDNLKHISFKIEGFLGEIRLIEADSIHYSLDGGFYY